MERELATQRQDLPHTFRGAGGGLYCVVCGGLESGPLHRVQTATEQASDSNPNTTLHRELGS